MLNIKFKATDKNSSFIPFTSAVKLTGDTVSSLMDLQVIVVIPLHMRTNELQVPPMMQALPQYRMSTGTMANKWNNFIGKNTFSVGDINSDFNSIQACLNAVPAGALIRVYPGLYNETVSITKSVTLVGAPGSSSTFLTSAVTISASRVTLDGFTFKSNSINEAMLRIDGSHVQIQNCKFTGWYTVDQPIDLHNTELAISCNNCRHVKIFNNIFFHCMFALSVDNGQYFTIRSSIFSYGHTSIVLQRSADVVVSGNLFEFNRAIVWLDNSTTISFADNVKDNNLQSDVCLQHENQIMDGQKLIYLLPEFGELQDLECHHLNVLPTANIATRNIMVLPDHLVLKGWCGSQVDKNQALGIPGIEEQLFAQSGCILVLGNVVATVYPQGTYPYLIINFVNGLLSLWFL